MACFVAIRTMSKNYFQFWPSRWLWWTLTNSEHLACPFHSISMTAHTCFNAMIGWLLGMKLSGSWVMCRFKQQCQNTTFDFGQQVDFGGPSPIWSTLPVPFIALSWWLKPVSMQLVNSWLWICLLDGLFCGDSAERCRNTTFNIGQRDDFGWPWPTQSTLPVLFIAWPWGFMPVSIPMIVGYEFVWFMACFGFCFEWCRNTSFNFGLRVAFCGPWPSQSTLSVPFIAWTWGFKPVSMPMVDCWVL